MSGGDALYLIEVARRWERRDDQDQDRDGDQE